jgi:dipeptidyl aminopeptidase/acylaminoacyl peptidase
VLIIHGDDDYNVPIDQSTLLVRRLQTETRVHVETLLLPDQQHDPRQWRAWLATLRATAEFLERMLRTGRPG